VQNFCGDGLKNARDIRNQIFVLPEKVGQSLPKLLKTCYPLRPPIIPNFIEIVQTSLEKALQNLGLGQRGATKKQAKYIL